MASNPWAVVTTGDVLGEGPGWDDRSKVLVWVDIRRHLVATWDPRSRTRSQTTLPDEVSLCLPCAGPGFVAAQVDRLVIGQGGTWVTLCEIDAENPHTRLNDGGVDPAGRLWVGTYSTRGEPESGLYCVSATGTVTRVLDGLVAANGLGWSPDGSLLYLADTGRCRVDILATDPAGGTALQHVGTLFEDDGSQGRPDGLAVDRDGNVWIAMWGGGHLRCYGPEGTLLDTLPTPVTFPTSVAFGDDDLATLYVTTSSHHVEDPAGEPAAGSLLTRRAEVPGLPPRGFAW